MSRVILRAGSVGELYALPSDRTTVWKPGVTNNGGIPSNRTKWGATLTPSDGQAAIQNALDTADDNTYVLLAAGTYNLTASGSPALAITRSNITLRGSGAGVTILNLSSGAGSVVGVGTWNGIPKGWLDWRALTADAVKEGSSVTVSDASGLVAGELVHVNEQYDSNLTYYNNRAPAGDCGPLQSTDYLGWGECRCATTAECTPPGCITTSDPAVAQAQSRPIGQAMEIDHVSGNTVYFTTPFHWTFRVSRNAHIARLLRNYTVDTVETTPVRNVGVENLTVQHTLSGANLDFIGTVKCWAKNVEAATQQQGASFNISGGVMNEIRDSYAHQAEDPNPGGAGYSLQIESYAADNLVENSIFWSFNKVATMRSSGGGNVIGYNYFEDGYGQGYPTIVEVGINASHMAGSHMELFEGNQGFNFGSDTYWGSQNNIVGFRNHLTTLRRNLPGNLAELSDESNRLGIGITSFQRNYSFVGNVIGYPEGYLSGSVIGHDYPTWSPQPQSDTFVYEWTGTWGPVPMWQIGYDGSGYDCTSPWKTEPDSITTSTILRDGNYDYVSNQVHWHGIGGSGVDNGLDPPTASTLPDSLYLSAKPAFFGSTTWPWVTPTESTRVHTLPARTRFDLGTPNDVP